MRFVSHAPFRGVASCLLLVVIAILLSLGSSTIAHAVELKLDGSKTLLSGAECGLGTYRLGTQNSYAGKNLDLILEITEEDNDYVGPCVQLTGNQVSFYLRDEDAADNVAYMDLKFTVVEKGTMTPVEVDRILVTNFDLDRSNSLSLSATDDVYYKDADGAYISSNSLVQYSEGSFYGGKYNAKMRGKDNGNCNDGTTTTDVTCRAAAIWINGASGPNKVSTIYARAQNDNAYGTYNHPQALRLIQFSFELIHFQGLVTVASDYGDAPNSYGSAGHKSDVNIGLGYGEIADSEAAHQASNNADGDDTDATGFDDDNAVTLGGSDLQGQTLQAETTQNLSVTTFGTGYLNAWVDWNRDGDFSDANEQILDDQHITTTSVAHNTIPVAIPEAVTAGNSFMRFRFSATSGIGATGYSSSVGEVEDYLVVLDIPEDHGDAPSGYGEASHSLPSSNSTWLGTVSSPVEATGSSSSDATGDDSDGTDDEDAFTSSLPELIVNETSYSLDVPCVGSGVVAGWVDFNRNSSFQSNERASANCSGGKASLSWSSISGQSVGSTYARFRIASNTSDVTNPTGQALDGEVEDYPFTIANLKPTEFVCDGKPYTVIGSPSTLQEMNKSTLAVNSLGNFNPAIDFNGIGYNTLDNFIYGYSSGSMYRVGYNREIEDLGVPSGSGSFDPKTHTGTMDTSGKFYGISSSKIFIVDVGNNPDPGTLTFTTVSRSGSSTVPADIAFSTFDGKLYGMSGSKLYRIDPVSGHGEQVSVTGDNLIGNAGGAWSTADGSVYLYNNSNGKLFKADTSQSPVVVSNLGFVANNGSFDATACIPPSLQKKTSSAEVTLDEVFEYTFIINNPNATSISVSITDTLPANLSFESGSLAPATLGGGSVSTFTDKQLSINGITVPGSSKLEFTVSVKVATDAPEGNIDNQASMYYGSNTYLSDDPDTGAIEDPTRVTVKYVYDYGDAPDDASDFKYGLAKHRVSANPGLFLGNKKANKDQESEVTSWYNEWSNGNHKGWFKNNKDRRSKGNGNKKKDEPEEPMPQVVGDGDEEDGLSTTEFNWQNGSSCTGLLPDGTQGVISITEDRFCLTVKASNQSTIAAQLVGWIDFNQNGEFDDPLERSVVDVDGDTSNDDTQGNVPAGTDNQDVVLYWEGLNKISGQLNTFIRTRITSDPEFKSDHSPDPIGVAINGEVEDTNIGINVEGTDYGDAPDIYGDASHIIELDVYMGTIIDNDNDSQNSANGGTDVVGDDNDGYDDDDGVTSFPSIDTNAQTYSIDVTVTSPATSAAANLVGWIDFDQNNVFDADEAATIVVPQNTTESTVTLTWSSIPGDIEAGDTHVRLRLTTDNTIATGLASTSQATGLAQDGEVEDYSLNVIVGWPVPPVTGPGDGGQCLMTHHTNPGVAADPNSFYNIGDHLNPATLTKIGPWNVPSGTVEGLTADVANEVFYALNANRSGKLWLGSIDPVSGSFTDITTTGSSTLSHSSYGSLSITQSRAIAHQSGTNTLWVAAYDAQPTSGPGSTHVYLFQMSTLTGEVVAGAFGGDDYLAIDLAPYTFNSSNDRPSVEALTFYKNEPDVLYGVLSTLSGGSPNVGHLFAVDLSKNKPQAVLAPQNLSGVIYSGGAAPASDYYDIEGMSFDENGDLVVVSSNVGGTNANSLFNVDLATGAASGKRTIISGDWEGIVCDPLFAAKDYGDAPSDLSSIDASLTAVYGEAGHVLDEATYLGSLADAESGSQDSGLNADGDDLADSNDDDGVAFPQSGSTNVLRVGESNTLTVTASKAGVLNAWIDWNQDGDWDDTGEQIATDQSLVTGANTLSVTPLILAPQGKTYARFRFSSISGLSPTGLVADGEVEDYAVNLTLSTPANVCSPALLNNGFETPVVPASLIIQLEETIEGWATQAVSPTSGANYEQRNSIEIWESGFQGVPAYQGNQFAELNAYVSGALYQDVELPPGTTVGWSFAHRARTGINTIKVLMGPPDAPVSQGQFSSDTTKWNVFSGTYTVPVGQTITRFAFQSVDSGSLGNFIDAIQLPGGCDFGDAPDSYKTKLSSGGAHHVGNSSLYLGAEFADSEEAAFGGDDVDDGGDASDDDNEGDRPDDEDGVASFDEIDDLDTTYSLAVTVNNTSGASANLVGWIDFDGDGVFGTDEGATLSVANNTSGEQNLVWSSIPNDITSGDSFVRLRLTTDSSIATGDATTSLPGGMAKDGEVEDYPLFIKVGGFPVKGRVYIDADVDGVNDINEKGISNLPVALVKIESNPANNTCVSVRTDGDGNYEFFPVIPGDYQLYEASLQKVPVPDSCGVANVKDPQDYRSTTPSVLAQFSVVDAEITGKDFGDVKLPVFDPDHADSVMPGNSVHYAHKFTTKSSGDVTFTQIPSANQSAGWTSTLFADSNCNGVLDGAESQLSISTAFPVIEGTDICIINKVYAPANIVAGDRYTSEINADFDYGNATAGTVSLKVTDLTTALASNDSGGYSKLELRKTVQVYRGAPLSAVSGETETQSAAKPGDILQYRIYYSNSGTADLTDLVINDVVPEFTVLYGSPSCETPLPASLNTCTPSVSGDDVEWLFPANDALQGGQSGMVSYQVQVE